MNVDVREECLAAGLPVGSVFAFSAEGYDGGGDFAARMFFDAGGLREDPATGSANAAFAAYLRDRIGRTGEFVVDQGVEIERPSRIYLDVGEVIAVGGKVQQVVVGEL